MIKDVLNEIGGIGLYGIISLSLFFLVFGGSLIWAFFLKKPLLDSISRLPLEKENATLEKRHED